MMKHGIVTNYLMISAEEIIHNGILMLDDDDVVRQICSMDNLDSEPANTIFMSGWLSLCVDLPDIVYTATLLTESLKQTLKKSSQQIRIGEKVILRNYRLDKEGRVVAADI